MVQKSNPEGTHGKVSLSPDPARSPVSVYIFYICTKKYMWALFLLKKKKKVAYHTFFSEPEFLENSMRFPTFTDNSQAEE